MREFFPTRIKITFPDCLFNTFVSLISLSTHLPPSSLPSTLITLTSPTVPNIFPPHKALRLLYTTSIISQKNER